MSLVKRYSKQLIGFAGFSSLLVLWQLAGFLNILPKFVLPTPLEIGTAFVLRSSASASSQFVYSSSGLDRTCYRRSSCCRFCDSHG